MNEPKIVLFDLEIIPNLQKALEYWPMLNCSWDSSTTLKAEVTSICSIGFEVFGHHTKPQIKNLWAYESWKDDVNDDKELCVFAYELLKDADALVYHNGDRFDLKYLQTRLAFHGLPLLPKIPTIDTKKLVKKHLFLLRNSLDHASSLLTESPKMHILDKWQLWIDTHNRKAKAMRLMSDYCKQDIASLRELFKKLRPIISNIPNYNIWNKKNENICPMCGSTRVVSNGYRATRTKHYQRLKCLDCGGSSRTNVQGLEARSL